jgi:hypothetical protein
MVFTDPPAAVNSSNPVVNNLDLLVTDSAGAGMYWGNRFSGGQSITGGNPDPINNVEQVLLDKPYPAVHTIQVLGTGVNQATQGFAIVVTGQVVDGAYNLPPSFGDYDGDGDRDLADFAGFQECYGGLKAPDDPCAVFDADDDFDVDTDDFAVLRQLWTGP